MAGWRARSRAGFAVAALAAVGGLIGVGCKSGTGGIPTGAGGTSAGGTGGASTGGGGKGDDGAGGSAAPAAGGGAGTSSGAAGAAGTGGVAGTGGDGAAGGSAQDAGDVETGTGGRPPEADGSIAPDVADDGPTCVTSVSGTVYDPAGQVPLHDAWVYSPTTPLAPIPSGASCDHCATAISGAPAGVAHSDVQGRFKLTDIQPGTDVPLVIQVGKWRRQIAIPVVIACADNPIDDVNQTRLPRTQAEGNIPRIAIATGRADALECFVRKIGIADSEFTISPGNGRVNLFAGGEPVTGGAGQGATSFSPDLGAATFPPATELWSNVATLMTYDVVVLSCEGSQFDPVKRPFLGNLKAFADAGGRLVTGHLQYYWLRNGPAPWPTTAVYLDPQIDLPDPTLATVNTSFPLGAALADWLLAVGASPTRGALTLYGASSEVASVNAPTRSWLTTNGPISTTMLTFDTPVEALPGAHCGRVANIGQHVKSTIATQVGKDTSSPALPFPGGCRSTVMTAQERALEFLFFHLGACTD